MYIVDTCRCPNASYSVSSTICAVIPSRDAVSRSITNDACSPPTCMSLATSRSSGRVCSFSRSRRAQSVSSDPSAHSRLYWNWVRLTRSSTVRSWTGCMNRVMPSIGARRGWSLRMTSLALTFLSSRGRRLIWSRPVFGVVLMPSTPMKDDRLSTAGSSRIAFASVCWRSAIAANDTVSGASETPRITPVSWTGKNPFGTMT